MSLSYGIQQTQVVFGSKSGTTPTGATLTAAYTGNASGKITCTGMSKMNIDLIYTTGTGETNNSIELKIECSPDGTNWYRIPNVETSGGTSTLTQREFTFVGASAATAYTISLGLDIFYHFIKISAKETGVATNFGTLYGELTLSGE